MKIRSKSLHWIFLNSSTKISDQKLSYLHLPSFAVTSKTLLAFKFPSIGYFHFVVLVFSYSLKVHFMPILTKCFIIYIIYSRSTFRFFYYKPYNMACIFGNFIILEIKSSNSYETLNETLLSLRIQNAEMKGRTRCSLFKSRLCDVWQANMENNLHFFNIKFFFKQFLI